MVSDDTRPFDERLTPLTRGATLTLLGVMALGWLGMARGLAFLLTPVVVLVCWRPLAQMVKGAVRRPGPVLLGAGIGMLALLALVPWMDHVVPWILGLLGQPPSTSANQESLQDQFAAAPVLMSVMIGLVGPLQEELVYRFGLFRTLSRWGPGLAHAMTAVAFAAQHTLSFVLAGDLGQLVPATGYLAAGVVLSAVYAKTRNLGAPLLAHILANTISLILAPR